MRLRYPQTLTRGHLSAAGVFLLAAIALGAAAWGSRGDVSPAPGNKSNRLAEATARPVKIVGASPDGGCGSNAWPYFGKSCQQDQKQNQKQNQKQENTSTTTRAQAETTALVPTTAATAASIAHPAVDLALNAVAKTAPISTDGLATTQDAALAARIAPMDVQQNAAIRPDAFSENDGAITITNNEGNEVAMPTKRRRHTGRRYRHHRGIFPFGF